MASSEEAKMMMTREIEKKCVQSTTSMRDTTMILNVCVEIDDQQRNKTYDVMVTLLLLSNLDSTPNIQPTQRQRVILS